MTTYTPQGLLENRVSKRWMWSQIGLRFKAQLPQQVFLEQLEDFDEVNATEWAARMPEGLRERIASDVLREIYSAGKTAEAWARDFIRVAV